MGEEHLRIWEGLFRNALDLLDSARQAGAPLENWSFGGGTVLMRRYRHRISKDVDIFVPDVQCLGYFSPRLSSRAESLTSKYQEDSRFIKLYFAEGEIDFVASAPLTARPTIVETVLGREVNVETSAEIVAKKVWHRGAEFAARDLFDLALVATREPAALKAIRPMLRERRDAILDRVARYDKPLRTTFAALETLEFRPSYDECLAIVRKVLSAKA